MKPSIAALAALALFTACGVNRGEPRKQHQEVVAVAVTETVSNETFALGSTLTPEGAVPRDAAGETFVRGGEVFLSVDVGGARTDHRVQVAWVDPHGRTLRRDDKQAPVGKRYVAFSSGRTKGWPAGPHRAVIMIDGRRVSEKEFGLM